ncbi:hypothetical protein NTD80_03390 [Pseudomonas sp. 13B_2.1_Bac1]|uniref:hypothetical protein n=1 Tax=Pseudomonas sp. 13B_2.1_Bac1 TaxID=2971624 RepID=UPI0021C5E025|nr:hypothetical protein [Pseudomonas sp. 13B_2.1_Bac1]MCU1781787.1 hypothetical protein [Pseudomonas sp. 13B_2.1_Bac1]
MSPLPQKVIKALKSYVPDDDQNSPETLSILSDNNLIFKTKTITHNESVQWLFTELKKIKKATIINDFIYGAQESAPDYRAALSAFAIAQNFPPHDFAGPDVYCSICGGFLEQIIDLTFVNSIRYTYGSLQILTPVHIAFYLEQHNRQPHAENPSYDRLKKIIIEIFKSSHQETPTSLANRLSSTKGINIKKNEIRGLLETLGYAGILETPQHKGYIYQFHPSSFRPSKSHKSNWEYPIDFWTGERGINLHAMEFWFSEYRQIFEPLTRGEPDT